MEQTDLNDILLLLTVGIYADKRVHSNEIAVFTQSLSRLELSKNDMPKISEAKALAWFEMNKDNVRHIFNAPRPDFNRWFIPILERVGQHANKSVLLRLLTDIFLADDEMHVSEAALDVLIRRVWKIA